VPALAAASAVAATPAPTFAAAAVPAAASGNPVISPEAGAPVSSARTSLQLGAAGLANSADAAPALAALFSAETAHAGIALPEVAPAPSTIYNLDILKKLGVSEKFLTGGGVKIGSHGVIEPVKKPLTVKVYDNDDNVVYLGTQVYLKHKTTGEEKALTTAEFAAVRPEIGKSGPMKEYDYFKAADGGSFRDFLDGKNPNVFAQDVATALNSPSGTWRAPFYFNFATALADGETAPWVAILTSRGHEPENAVKGYEVMKQRAGLKNTPRAELIWGVDTDKVRPMLPTGLKTPEKKTAFLISALDLIESVPMARKGRRHTLEYSDDDADMINKVRDLLTAEAAKKRWPHVNIKLYSTGVGREGTFTIKPR